MKIFDHLALVTSQNTDELKTFIQDAPHKYKVYTIPKRTYGVRTIAQPTAELKQIQKITVDYLQKKLPVHPAASAYIKGKGIKHNASQHRKNQYLLKLDFEDFFNSITPHIFWNICESILDFLPCNIEKTWYEKILFWCPSKKSQKLILSIGAPSSPFISNFCMYLFDKSVYEYCIQHQIIYTRYADDLTFSTNKKEVLFPIPMIIKDISHDHFKGRLRLNKLKTKFSSKAHNRHVTGVTITNDNKISIGRDKKRYIKSLVYRYKIKQLSMQELSLLKGLLAFSNDIEPLFITTLENKYSVDVMASIFKVNHEKIK